jgi:hypothetical protein
MNAIQGSAAGIDGGMRLMEQKIERAGLPRAIRRKPVKKFCCFRFNAGQVRGGAE